MKLGTIKSKFSSLHIGVSDALPAHVRNRVREISAVTTKRKHRHKGHGANLMRAVCAQADCAGMTLLLQVAPFDDNGLSAEQLERWYSERFGFVTIQQEPKLMARQPNQTRILRSA